MGAISLLWPLLAACHRPESSHPLDTELATTPFDTDGAADTEVIDTDDTDVVPPELAIHHVVIIIQENHTFDDHFGRYCTAAAGSSPACTEGPACCEAAPPTEPSGGAPRDLTDALNGNWNPDHTMACEVEELNGGAMDGFVTGPDCADRRNFAIIPADLTAPYHRWAEEGAIADRYFQSIAGSSGSNDMYFAVAKYVFTDNDREPDTIGEGCSLPGPIRTRFDGETTIADLLLAAGHSFAFYAEGYQDMKDSTFCPWPPDDCRWGLPTAPCVYDPGDVPFQYYGQFADDPATMKDYAELGIALDAGTLPDVSFVKGLAYRTEHPGFDTRVSDGVGFVEEVVDRLETSTYASDTLILIVFDEGGGWFDHVPPPPNSAVDGQPYGTRVPMVALGPFARRGAVSHVTMEHSSIVRFLEWAFLDGQTGQLGARDAAVENIGSLLDPATTGVTVP